MASFKEERRVSFALRIPYRPHLTSRGTTILEPLASSSMMAHGWALRIGSGYALGYKEAKRVAECLMRRIKHSKTSFCVLGDVPASLDQAQNRCGCTAIVLHGTRMKLPEKIFAYSFVEFFRGETIFCVDVVGALQQWAQCATEALDAKYAGDANAWSNWCERYRADRWWPETVSEPQLRDEWDWTFRCGCEFEARAAQCGDWWQQGALLSQSSKVILSSNLNFGKWINDDFSPNCLFSKDMTFTEHRTKIYEDFLSDIGLASLVCRCRYGSKGVELRLSWFTCTVPDFN